MNFHGGVVYGHPQWTSGLFSYLFQNTPLAWWIFQNTCRLQDPAMDHWPLLQMYTHARNKQQRHAGKKQHRHARNKPHAHVPNKK